MKAIKIIMAAFGLVMVMGFLGAMIGLYQVSKSGPLPTLPETLVEANSPIAFHSCDGDYLKSSERFIYVSLDKIPLHVRQAFLASEDADFYSHYGVSPRGLARAAWNKFRHGWNQGGSTITQQVARNLFLSLEKTGERKIREILLAIRMEHKYTKDQILEAYLNSVSFGAGIRGIGAAARHFFNKEVAELTVAEAAMLAGILPRPAGWNPVRFRQKANVRKEIVLKRMWACNFLSDAEFQAAWLALIVIKPSQEITHATDHFVKMVTEQLPPEVISGSNQSVITTLDMRFQRELHAAIQDGLAPTDRLLRLKPYSPKMSDAEKAKYPQTAVVALRTQTGEILAMAGSREPSYGFEFNRAVQPQQPGSTAKIFTYTYGIRRGFLPNTRFCDRPMTILMPAGSRTWKPSNYGDRYRGWLTMSDALRQSLNGVAIAAALGDVTDADTLNAAGNAGPDSIVALSRDFGIKSPWKPFPSVAIGAVEATLLEMAYAYAALANGGMYHPPKLIEKINGQLVADDSTKSHRAISEQEAYIATSMFRNVLRPGGTAASFFDRVGREFPAAGKTGTTNDSRDCWFVLFTPEIVVAVWVGYDDNRALRNGTGSSAAMPIAAEFIKRIAGQLAFPDWPEAEKFGLKMEWFDPITGEIRASEADKKDGDLEAAFPVKTTEIAVDGN